MPSEAEILANQLTDEFIAAENEADREAIRPAALAAAEGALAEAIATFKEGTAKILDLSGKLEAAIHHVSAPGSKARLHAIAERLGKLASKVHDVEGMRTTWESTEEFDATSADEDDLPASGQHTPIPIGSGTADGFPGQPLSTSRKFPDLADEYVRLFRAARYKDRTSERTAAKLAETALSNRRRYEAVGAPLQIPWWFIAGTHLLESSYNFKTHLHNGDNLSAQTFRVPAGRPASGKAPFTWEFSAEDALRGEGFANLSDWSLARALYRWESYNGWGYRGRRVATPYLWSFSSNYSRGKYIGDGVFSADAISQQCGAAVLLKALIDQGAVKLEVEIFDEGGADATVSDAADAQSVVDGTLPNIDGAISGNADFQNFFQTRLPDVKHFQWHEFLVKGASNEKSSLNTDPPMDLWPNILLLARILERFREEIGHPVIITSVYRSPQYNATLPGAAKASQHMQFRATDIKVIGTGNPKSWAAILRRYRDDKMFEGGIGTYNTFVHVDTRGHNVDW